MHTQGFWWVRHAKPRYQNKCILRKWFFKLIKEGTWQDLLTRKYLSNKTFWSRLMKVKDQFLARGSFLTHSGIGSVFGRRMDWQQTSQN